jgi:hypothetical protein
MARPGTASLGTAGLGETPLRASSTADCARKAAFEGSAAPDREWTDREQRILYRGRSLGRDYADWLEAKYGVTAVEREVKVEWKFGIGHIDVFLWPTLTVIEVLSTKHATDTMIHRKLLQTVLYMEHYEPALNGCLIVLDPGDFTEERFPVAKETEAYEHLVEEVINRIEQLEAWRDGGDLPARVCRRPSEAVGHFCRYADTCFADWEPDPLPVFDRPEVVVQAADVWRAKEAELAIKWQLADLEAERKAKEQVLAELLDGQPKEGVAGPYRIRRTDVQRKPTLDVKRAELAGVLNTELLGEFMRPGAAYTTWAVDRHEGAPGDVDYGEEAPW